MMNITHTQAISYSDNLKDRSLATPTIGRYSKKAEHEVQYLPSTQHRRKRMKLLKLCNVDPQEPRRVRLRLRAPLGKVKASPPPMRVLICELPRRRNPRSSRQ
jgi:hypothetical protein